MEIKGRLCPSGFHLFPFMGKKRLLKSICQTCSQERLNVSGKEKGDREPFTSRSLA